MDLDTIYDKIVEKFDYTKVLKNEPMSKHTSFKLGGKADIFIKATSVEDITYIINLCKTENIPITIIGNGTNLLVKDNGIRGIVIKIDIQEIKIEKEEDKVYIKAGAGVPLAKISKLAEENSATGLEFAIGIPGSIGGAVYMNAGAYGSEMRNVVKTTKYMDFDGNIKQLSNNEQKFEYRNSVFSQIDGIIIETELELELGKKQEIQHIMEENTKSRKEKQPLDKPNAGSTFKRGNGFIAAKLIDECGLKGYKIGGATVSSKHAGFIVNENNATSKDVLNLIEYVKQRVNEKYDVNLETEIKIIGE